MQQQQIDVLQQFRNRVLLATPEGRRCVVLYYVHAPELMLILRRNEDLRAAAGEFMQAASPCLDLRLMDGHAVIPRELLEAGLVVSGRIAEEAGPRLRASIETLKQDIVHGELLMKLGIAVNGADQ